MKYYAVGERGALWWFGPLTLNRYAVDHLRSGIEQAIRRSRPESDVGHKTHPQMRRCLRAQYQ